MFDLGLTVSDKTQIVQSLAAKCTQSAANERPESGRQNLAAALKLVKQLSCSMAALSVLLKKAFIDKL
jgi:hypothetical protein